MGKIILIIILIFVLTGTSLVSATGIVDVPVFSDIFYREKISDLGIQISSEAVEKLSQKIGFTPAGLLVQPVPIGLIPIEPKIIEITDVELTSWGDKWITEAFFIFPPLENFQIKLEEGKYISSIRVLDPAKFNLTIFGRVSRKDQRSINLEFERIYIGNLRIPFTEKQVGDEIERQINRELAKIENLRIDRLEILKGKMIFEGILPPELNKLQFADFLPIELPGGFKHFLPGFDEKIPVIITLKEQFEGFMEQCIKEGKSRVECTEERKLATKETQRSLMLFLEQIQAEDIRQFHIINAIAAKIPTRFRSVIAERPEVDRVVDDREIRLIDPIRH